MTKKRGRWWIRAPRNYFSLLVERIRSVRIEIELTGADALMFYHTLYFSEPVDCGLTFIRFQEKASPVPVDNQQNQINIIILKSTIEKD